MAKAGDRDLENLGTKLRVTALFTGDRDPLDRFKEGVARVPRPGGSSLSVDRRGVAPHRRQGRR